jgi:hypothetical protein
LQGRLGVKPGKLQPQAQQGRSGLSKNLQQRLGFRGQKNNLQNRGPKNNQRNLQNLQRSLQIKNIQRNLQRTPQNNQRNLQRNPQKNLQSNASRNQAGINKKNSGPGVISSFKRLDREFGFRSALVATPTWTDSFGYSNKQTPVPQQQQQPRQRIWAASNTLPSSEDLLTVKIENDQAGAGSRAAKNRAKRERQKLNRAMVQDLAQTPINAIQG